MSSSILIKGMDMPSACNKCRLHNGDICTARGSKVDLQIYLNDEKPGDCQLLEVPTPHGRLIDADALRKKMYHEAFETDTPMVKWDSGCWIRYKMFEKIEERLPTIIEASTETKHIGVRSIADMLNYAKRLKELQSDD